jgi:biopolymer transport protein ExbB/TolQ
MLLVITLLAFGSALGQEQPAADMPESAPLTLDELLNQVRTGTTARRTEMAVREQRFIEAREERARLLSEIEQQRRDAEALADQIRADFERGEAELADLETELEDNAGDLREVFNVARQTAGDALPTLQNSMVRAQFPLATDLLDELSTGDTTPTSGQLRELWLMLLEEMNESGKVARFERTVIGADGVEARRTVTRIGTFAAVAGMIETFQVITLFGAGDPRLMPGGISQALITTQLGLSVAIPLLLAHSFVQSRVNALIATLDESAAEIFAISRSAREGG